MYWPIRLELWKVLRDRSFSLPLAPPTGNKEKYGWPARLKGWLVSSLVATLIGFPVRPYQFDFLIHEWRSQKKWGGRLKYIHICNYESHYKLIQPRCTTWEFVLLDLDLVTCTVWAPQRSFSGVTKSVCSLCRNCCTRNQGCFSLFNCRLASYVSIGDVIK